VAHGAMRRGWNSDVLPHSTFRSNVVGDPGAVRQVLLNLLSNAVKFTSFRACSGAGGSLKRRTGSGGALV